VRVARMSEGTCGAERVQGPGERFAYPGYACHTTTGDTTLCFAKLWKDQHPLKGCNRSRKQPTITLARPAATIDRSYT